MEIFNGNSMNHHTKKLTKGRVWLRMCLSPNAFQDSNTHLYRNQQQRHSILYVHVCSPETQLAIRISQALLQLHSSAEIIRSHYPLGWDYKKTHLVCSGYTEIRHAIFFFGWWVKALMSLAVLNGWIVISDFDSQRDTSKEWM